MKNIITIILVLALFGWILQKMGCVSSSSSYSSSSSNSSASHTCGQCGKSYSGNGWSTAGGEQFQYDHDPGYDASCSRNCAYNSQPKRWKR